MLLSAQNRKDVFYMTKQFVLSLSVAVSLMLSGLFSFPTAKGCFLPGFIPSPALEQSEEKAASVEIISSDECSFGIWFIEWLEDIF